jgi:hypothetical protein
MCTVASQAHVWLPAKLDASQPPEGEAGLQFRAEKQDITLVSQAGTGMLAAWSPNTVHAESATSGGGRVAHLAHSSARQALMLWPPHL